MSVPSKPPQPVYDDERLELLLKTEIALDHTTLSNSELAAKLGCSVNKLRRLQSYRKLAGIRRASKQATFEALSEVALENVAERRYDELKRLAKEQAADDQSRHA
ncbi:MAG: hypothetical protein HC898_12610 [Phycisphaerales bacterium]|nr:hypothetical protein [Phycisphaerales bacterium]